MKGANIFPDERINQKFDEIYYTPIYETWVCIGSRLLVQKNISNICKSDIRNLRRIREQLTKPTAFFR